MDDKLKSQIHRFAENREIDYVSAKNLGNTYGIDFKNETELIEFKQLIDKYLKTFKEDDFGKVEEACSKKNKKDKKKIQNESYQISAYASDEVNDMVGDYQPKKEKTKKKDKKKKQNESKKNITLEDMFTVS